MFLDAVRLFEGDAAIFFLFETPTWPKLNGSTSHGTRTTLHSATSADPLSAPGHALGDFCTTRPWRVTRRTSRSCSLPGDQHGGVRSMCGVPRSRYFCERASIRP